MAKPWHTMLVANSYYFDKKCSLGNNVYSKKHIEERTLCIGVDSKMFCL